MTSKPSRLRSLQIWAILLSLATPSLAQVSSECAIAGVTDNNWFFGFTINDILDTDVGTTFSGATENTVITSSAVVPDYSTNAGPYVSFRMENGNFEAYLLDAFADFEEYEYSGTLANNLVFPCHSEPLTVRHSIVDTNNHSPVLQSDTTIALATPLTAGALVPDEIIVRDIDITTSSITFEISENDYFDIHYIGRDEANMKNFHARLITKTLILGLDAPVSVTINATDNDLTGDPQRFIEFTLTIFADPVLSIPPSPVFSQAYYSGTYTAATGLLIPDTIEIISGYDINVNVALSGDDSSYFALNNNNGVITLSTDTQNPIAVPVPNNALTFIITAIRQDEPTIRGTAAVFISVPEEPLTVLQFEQSYYSGTIENGAVIISTPIRLVDEFGLNVQVSIINDHATYFTASISGNEVTITPGSIPESILEDSMFLNLVLEASEDDSVSARTVVTLTIIPPAIVAPVFSQAVYSGSYHSTNGLQFTETISLIDGYDDTVDFYLDGDHSLYFEPTVVGNQVTLSVVDGALPGNVIEDNDNLFFLVVAVKDAVSSTATVHISLPLDLSLLTLQFEQNNYVGTLENGVVSLSTPVTLAPGFGPNVVVQIANELASYFTTDLAGNQITISAGAIPEDVLTASTFLNLVLEATEEDFVSATTVVTLTVVTADIISPVFSQAVYGGSYHPSDGLSFTELIQLAEGFDETVEFEIQGEHSVYFETTTTGNQVELSVDGGSIPVNVVEGNENLIFLVVATKGSLSTSAAIHISLPIDISSITLQFGQDYYTGTIENGVANIPNPILLADGFGSDINVGIINEHSSYFTTSLVGNEVTVTSGNIPEGVLENNSFLNLVLQASEDGFASATTVLTLTIINEDPVTPVFSQSLYSGIYDQEAGLQFPAVISLTDGFDASVQFTIEGDHSAFFEETVNGNEVTLAVVGGSLPVNVVENNAHLVFLVVARKGTVSASAAISIELTSEDAILQFEENYYAGTVENGQVNVPVSIALASGHGPNVAVNIINEHVEYFTSSISGSTVTIDAGAIPDNVIGGNNFLNLVLEASEPGFVSAITIVTLELIGDEPAVVAPVFSQLLYSGSYDETLGLDFTDVIELVEGFADTVVFTIEGEHSSYFEETVTGNGVTIAVSGGSLPVTVVEENSDLVFLVVATNGFISSSAAVHISLPTEDALPLTVLRFAQDVYEGAIIDGELSVPIISLTEVFSQELEFNLIDELGSYFTLQINNNQVNILLAGSSLPDVVTVQPFINLVLEASGDGFVSTTTVITLATGTEETTLVRPVFGATFYRGSYEPTGNLNHDVITLDTGYDETVVFGLEGGDSEFFEVSNSGSTVVLTVRDDSLPESVLETNNELLFAVTATRSGFVASATVHLTLPTTPGTDLTVLRFAQDVYEGAIIDGELSVPIISLTEVFSQELEFNLIDELGSYFTLQINNNQVNILLAGTSLPDVVTVQPFINLVLEAAGDGFVSTTTVITLTTGTEETTLVRPVFGATFYRGSYEPTGNLNHDVITLDTGYDESVVFGLEGGDSEFFEVSNSGSTVVLTVRDDSLPESVLETNSELLFAVTATRSGFVASATVHLTLPTTPGTDLTVLRFAQDVYEGAIIDGELSVPIISLTEVFSQELEFNLIDELGSYFTLQINNNQVNILLAGTSLPDVVTVQPFINLVLEAAGDGFVSTTTVITLTTGTEETTLVRPVFGATFYRGSYEPTGNLNHDVITLDTGYDESVVFGLEGGDSEFFEVSNSGSTVVLTVRDDSLPESVLETNSELLFAVTATRSGFVASATVHLTLPTTPGTDLTVLRFAQDVYEGAIIDGELSVPIISLTEVFSEELEFNLIDELGSYFTLQINNNQVNILLAGTSLPDVVTVQPFINLVLEASGDGFVSTTTVITLTTGTEETTLVRPVFGATFYRGSYEPTGNLNHDVITLDTGYDESVVFGLEGGDSEFFEVSNSGSTVVLTVRDDSLPESVLETNSELLFAVTATRSGFVASATVHLNLPTTSGTDLTVLRFAQDVYEGAFIDGELSVPTISLTEVFSQELEFNLIDELESYFTLQINNNQVNILPAGTSLPDVVTVQPFINLVIEASGDGFVSTRTVITIATGTEETTLVRPEFGAIFYRGSYEPTGNLNHDVITLDTGYDESVVFGLEGGDSEFFEVSNSGSAVVLTVRDDSLPESVLETNSELLFAVTAERNGFVASATVHLTLPTTSGTDLTVLRFAQDVYEGVIIDGELSVPIISLTEVFSQELEFNLIDELGSYFTLQINNNQVNILLAGTSLPDVVTLRPFINLVLEASGDGFVSTATVITLATGTEETTLVRPVFGATFYRGSYEPTGNLNHDVITLDTGYDESVVFGLEGGDSEFFEVSNSGSTVVLTVRDNSLPESVLETNSELLFAVTATRSGFVASATVHLTLPTTSGTDLTVLRFAQDVYEGAIIDGELSVPTISLTEVFSQELQFNLIDELGSYFTLQINNNQVNILLAGTSLPDVVTVQPFINLVLEASGDGFVSTTTVITLTTGTEETTLVRPVFGATFYRGSYEPTGNLNHDVITLDTGYDESVVFGLEGGDSEFFEVSNSGSTVVLTVRDDSLPESVLETNSELLFAVTATRSGFVASATVHLTLPTSSSTDLTVLRFAQDVFEGVIIDGELSVPTISLTEVFSQELQFNLIDELGSYFTLQINNNHVNILLAGTSLPDVVTVQPFINLVLEASGDGFVSTTTVITLTTGTEETTLVRPVFGATFYRGSYEPTGNLNHDVITLDTGYDESVVFGLEGGDSEYLEVSNSGSTVVLTVRDDSLPESVLETNSKLLFAVTATRSGLVASATVHLTLPTTSDTSLIVLRFEQDVYEGAINDGELRVPIISLTEVFSEDLEFRLIDEFVTYFTVQENNNQVNILLAGSSLPDAVTAQPFINLVLEASGDGFVSTTTVITLATGTPETTFIRPVFGAAFYRGSYEPAGNLDLEEISLDTGFDESVVFALDGDNSAYFEVSNAGSSVILTICDGSLPQSVLETYNEILFAVTATSNGFIASAAVHVALPIISETDLPSLAFGSEYYTGIITNNQLTTPIDVILVDGFDTAIDVQFNIEGEYNDHFIHVRNDNILRITLSSALPAELVAAVARINLVLRATSPNYNPASTVITISITPPITPVFSEVIYAGSYNLDTGLSLDNEIHLSQGFSEEVTFYLDGDHSRFFEPVITGNWIQLQSADPITEDVIQTNVYLSFSIFASREGTDGGSAAIIIDLTSAGSSEEISIPEVTFTSEAYHITASPSQTGVIGGVFASASNGELLQYALNTDDEHLSSIVNIGSGNGQVLLMSPANPGVYQAVVTATTTGTGVSSTADLTITVVTVIVCGVDDYALNPLIILERVEEQAFDDLVPLNSDLVDTCRYEILNSWPADQDWFYINENGGLSIVAVDREHPSIAFIHLSQIQVELALACENDDNFASQMKTLNRHARDVDFGNREWIITNQISYSRRQTSVNVIITDINDNAPVFVVNGNEPVTIGYPNSNALEVISPPFFTQVQATDADIGINAQILYSIQNQAMFTIHPETGVIYLMPQAMSTLADRFQFSVTATDENGNGHSTSMNIMVRLLSQSQITTLTISNAFLESEATIIENLSQQLNIDIRSLAAAVVPNSASTLSSSYYMASRILNRTLQRDTSESPTLTLHVYALDADLEPVEAATLISYISSLDDDDISWDISSSVFEGPNVVTIVEQISDAGLLAATIALSILIAVLVIGFVGWNIYTIRSNRYKHFSETNSVSSVNPDHPGKRDVSEILPRNNNDSNVQRDITGPYSGVIFNTITENQLKAEPAPKPTPVAPFINIIDEKPELEGDEAIEEDEFGEVQPKRRKSVVTFNEYVEQINIEKVPTEKHTPLAEFQRF